MVPAADPCAVYAWLNNRNSSAAPFAKLFACFAASFAYYLALPSYIYTGNFSRKHGICLYKRTSELLRNSIYQNIFFRKRIDISGKEKYNMLGVGIL